MELEGSLPHSHVTWPSMVKSFLTSTVHALISHYEHFTLEIKLTLNVRSKNIIHKDTRSSLSLHYQQQNPMKVTCVKPDILYVLPTTTVC
jgi:hypothetical protein